jgi:hypothetical protein
MSRFVLLVAAGLLLTATNADATQQGVTVQRGWKQMDNCARQAQAAYPNFDADSNAKRDAQLKACLNASNLPPREPLPPPGAR